MAVGVEGSQNSVPKRRPEKGRGSGQPLEVAGGWRTGHWIWQDADCEMDHSAWYWFLELQILAAVSVWTKFVLPGHREHAL